MREVHDTSNLTLHRGEEHAIALPEPRISVSVREAVASDLPFIDDLQKKHSKMVGWFPTKQIEANIKGGHVLIAETVSEPRPSGSGAVAGDPSVDEVRAQNPLPDGRGSVHRERVASSHARRDCEGEGREEEGEGEAASVQE